MAQLADILQQERERDTADKWGLIHLFKTGTFYSAYEWSAWLIAVITFNDEVRMATKDRKPLTVTRIPMKDSDETFCRVGFPLIGSFVKPYRDYVSNKTLERMTKKIQEIDLRNEEKAVRTIESYLGILSHTASRCITQDLLSKPLAA